MIPQTKGQGKVIFLDSNHWQLEIHAGSGRAYHLAQVDDYRSLRRKDFPHRPPFSLAVKARASHAEIPGTWGFGLWNDPFGVSLGFGGHPLHWPALPQAAWFFHASPENYLSFRDDQPANGFLAQVFRSNFHPGLLWAAALYPFSPAKARQWLAKYILDASQTVTCDVTEWHTYALTWQENAVCFSIDEHEIFMVPFAPRPPLGLAIWIDNQFAAFPPEGKLQGGLLPMQKNYWLEVILDEAGKH
ncbi:MAG: hypothetical protein ACK4VW_02345 [Anaerolineales bacterium]